MDRLALIIVIIGALNWLLIGFFEWDLVAGITYVTHRGSAALFM